MAKVIVERPRFGHRDRGRGKGYRRDWQRYKDDEHPKRERMKQLSRGGTKSFSEHLGPLKRYLIKQAGKNWNKVHSEICKYIDAGNVVQKHILTHVEDFVVSKVELIAGQAYYKSAKWGRRGPIYRRSNWGPFLYVCPKTNILKRAKPQPKQQCQKPLVVVERTFDTKYVRKAGHWYIATFRAFPRQHLGRFNESAVAYGEEIFDVVQDRTIRRKEAIALYRANIYAVAMRPAPKKERQRYCRIS